MASRERRALPRRRDNLRPFRTIADTSARHRLPSLAMTPNEGADEEVECNHEKVSSERGRRIDGRDSLDGRSEEHTSELQSLMRISYAVFCLKTKNKKHK